MAELWLNALGVKAYLFKVFNKSGTLLRLEAPENTDMSFYVSYSQASWDVTVGLIGNIEVIWPVHNLTMFKIN